MINNHTIGSSQQVVKKGLKEKTGRAGDPRYTGSISLCLCEVYNNDYHILEIV